jgi:hypothetical protein
MWPTQAGLHAQGLETPDGLVVLQGSQARVKEAPSVPTYIVGLREALVANGVLKRVGDNHVFTQDYVFSSPSTTAGIV